MSGVFKKVLASVGNVDDSRAAISTKLLEHLKIRCIEDTTLKAPHAIHFHLTIQRE